MALRRKKTRTEKRELKKAKALHNKQARLHPSHFEATRIDLASQIVTAIAKRPPRWGAFTFKFKQEGEPLTLVKI